MYNTTIATPVSDMTTPTAPKASLTEDDRVILAPYTRAAPDFSV
jgi:hypothetical protein